MRYHSKLTAKAARELKTIILVGLSEELTRIDVVAEKGGSYAAPSEKEGLSREDRDYLKSIGFDIKFRRLP